MVLSITLAQAKYLLELTSIMISRGRSSSGTTSFGTKCCAFAMVATVKVKEPGCYHTDIMLISV